MIERSPLAPVVALHRLLGDSPERLVGKGEIDALHLEQPLVLFHQRVLRFGEDALERRLVEVLQGCDHRKPADELRNQAIFEQIFRLDVAEDLAGLAVFRRDDLCGEADRGRAAAGRDDLLQP
jgi:hypothetical protein